MWKQILGALVAVAALPAAAAPPAPSFTVDDAIAGENIGVMDVVIRKHGKKSNSPSTVTYYTIGGTARPGDDYSDVRVTITFGANETSKTVKVPLVNDDVVEENEAFTSKLIAGSNARLYDGTASATIINDDVPPVQEPVEPAPPSPPDPGVPTDPAPTTAGDPPIYDNFDTALGIEVFDPTGDAGRLPPQSTEAGGAFRMRCNAGPLGKFDPLVYPGQADVGHLHQFWGNTGITKDSTSESLRTSGGTTCGVSEGPVNRTAYWMPAMLDGVGGVVKPDYINQYYKQLPRTSSECFRIAAKGCVGLPNHIRSVFGYDMTTGKHSLTDPESRSYWSFRYECVKSDSDPTPIVGGWYRSFEELAAANACPVGSQLNIHFGLPACWTGTELDTPDHRSHLSFGTPETGGQVCPTTHPYLITGPSGQVKFTVDANFKTWRLASDMAGAARGSSLHFDYWEAWSPAIKDRWQKNCIDGYKSCSSGDLGDGFWIKQTPVTPPHQVVPQPQ